MLLCGFEFASKKAGQRSLNQSAARVFIGVFNSKKAKAASKSLKING
jgi:hypothetical protein